MLARQIPGGFNEVIYARAAWERLGAPYALEAFIYCGSNRTLAARAWLAFRHEFASEPMAQAVPLLRVRAIAGRWSDFAVDSFEDVSASVLLAA